MSTGGKLIGFVVAAAAAFALGFGVGDVAGPFGDDVAPAHGSGTTTTTDHGMEHQ